MNAQQILYEFQMKRFKIFKTQDLERGKFDVIFDIEGKKLYANKILICSTSTTLDSMLSNRWTKLDEAVTIKDYKFDDFKEFLTFIYSGTCKLTNDNIFSMVDIAEYYGVQLFKNFCDQFITEKVAVSHENIDQMDELAVKYSLKQFKKVLDKYVFKHLSDFADTKLFKNYEKVAMKVFVKLNHRTRKQEALFEAVYKWAETRATEKQKAEEEMNFNEMIKEDLAQTLHLFRFDLMISEFFNGFVAKRSFIFSPDEWNDILLERKKVNVKIINGDGKVMKGKLECPDIEKVKDVINSQKDVPCRVGYGTPGAPAYCYWLTKQSVPPASTCKLIANDKVKWYLFYGEDGDLAIHDCDNLELDIGNDSDFLLAELYPEDGFHFDYNYKIEVFDFV